METAIVNFDNKRIALLYDCPYPFVQGGAQKRLFEIASRLVKKGWVVDWYALKFWEGLNEIQFSGINYKAVGRATALYKKNGKRSLKEALYYGLCFYRKFRLKEYDIIHAGQFPYFHLYFAKLHSVLSQTRLVIDWWEVWGTQWHEYAKKAAFLGRCLEWLSSKLSHHIIAISNQGRQDLIRLGANPDSIQVIHNGVNFAEIQTIQPSPDHCDLIYMGRLVNHKNIDHLIQALELLKQQNLFLKLEIIGDGPEYQKLVSLTQTLGLEDSVKFHGTIADQNAAFARLKSAKFFVHPSTKEGGGSIVAFEANACGIPVIAYKHAKGLAEELICDNINGYWVEGVSPAALAKKLMAIIKAEPLSPQKILAHAEQFDWQNLADQYFNYFQKIA